jgi:ribose 5-phosphate isomerase A
MTQDELKALVGRAALDHVVDGELVGVGTGSTVNHFIDALATVRQRVRGAVSSSEASTARLQAHGIAVVPADEVERLPVYIDGADEIDGRGHMIKGGGAALPREQLVWEALKSCVVIADAAKQVKKLGKFPLPIEVVAFGHKTTALRICDALAECDVGVAPRLRVRDGQPVRTDEGNLIYDAACGRIEEPAALAAALKSVTGVVDHGLFLDLADRALIGGPGGVTTLEP